jgi:hypothetical protein
MTLSIIVSSAGSRYAEYLVFYCYAECQYTKYYYAEYHYAEFRYGECRYAELHGALERLARDRHSNLFDPLVSCEKKFCEYNSNIIKYTTIISSVISKLGCYFTIIVFPA